MSADPTSPADEPTLSGSRERDEMSQVTRCDECGCCGTNDFVPIDAEPWCDICFHWCAPSGFTCRSGKPAAWLARIRHGSTVDHIELCDDCMASAQADPEVDLVGFRLLQEASRA